jgi:predicted ATP-dependent endonuclease of OLD family
VKLRKIKIRQFRSIEDLTIDFKENPRVLVGINESGKTNILHALRLLSTDFLPQKEDIRELPKGGIVEKSYVLFIFEFAKEEIEEIYKNIKNAILTDDFLRKIIEKENNKYNLSEICDLQKEGYYIVDVKKNSKNAGYECFLKGGKFVVDFRKPKLGTSFNFQNKNGTSLNISNFKLIDYEIYKDIIPEEHLERVEIEDLETLIGNEIIKIIQKNLPKVIFWEYKEENLLPDLVSIDGFILDPKSCIPLMNLFILADIPEDKIGEEIKRTREISFNSFNSLLKKIANSATKFFRIAWPEYKSIKFSLISTETNIRCGIEEKLIWDFKKRSDGFKRFISLLLILSIPAKKELLKNGLILIDGADIDLHPSGCRYLMKQLINLAENNYVIYSTHSIFMVDRENIERHYIVEKKNETTTIKEANEVTYRDEEVLYNALGTSAYEILEEKNILFEGWDDKKIFEVALEKNKEFKEFFENIGRSHSIGASSLKNFIPIVELSNRKIFILSDSDQTAIQYQEEFKNYKGYGVWKRYDEIFEERKIVTSEDFIKKETLQNKFCETLKKFGIDFQEDEFRFPENGKVNYIKNWLIKKNISEEMRKEIIKKLKNNIFKKLKINEIEEDYFRFLQKLREEIEKL